MHYPRFLLLALIAGTIVPTVQAETLALDCSMEIEENRPTSTTIEINLDTGKAAIQGTETGSLGGTFDGLDASISPTVVSFRIPLQSFLILQFSIYRPTLTHAIESIVDTNDLSEQMRSQAQSLFGVAPDENGLITTYATYGPCWTEDSTMGVGENQEEIAQGIRRALAPEFWGEEFEADSPLGLWGGLPVRQVEGLSVEEQLIITDGMVAKRAICQSQGDGVSWTTARSQAIIEDGRIIIQQDSIQRDRLQYYCAAELESGYLEYDVQKHILDLISSDGEVLSLTRIR